MTGDRITLTGLRVRGHHGVLEQERREGQDFVVDVVLELDLAPAAATDELTRTVHYGELAEQLAAVVAGPPVDLIETLAERLAAVCLAYDLVRTATVTVHKPQAPIALSFADVAVTVVRVRQRAVPDCPAVLSIGSNLGDRLAHLQLAAQVLAPYALSSVWQTTPVGGVEQADFLNAVVLCAIDADRAWELAQQAEQAAGRTRTQRWGPRTLDVDVVAACGPVPAGLILPHPRAHERAFVLAPWLELDPAARLPQGPVVDLLAGLDAGGVRRTGLRLDRG